MKKIGIITLYYKNNNYGGVAQAYALNKYFLKQGYKSELITYKKEKTNKKFITKKNSLKNLVNRIYSKIKRTIFEYIEKKLSNKFKDELKKREEKLECFRNEIPHSPIYTKDNISSIEKEYDIFVSGSDQCWNPGVVTGSFVFDFLNNSDKCIFSYSSSIAVDNFNEYYANFMKENLKKYKAVSVREKNTAALLEKSIEKKVEFVIDPTLLLTRNDWNSITSKNIIDGDYAFAYILGDDIKTRQKVKKIAKEKKLKLVTLPYIKNGANFDFKLVDYKFGEEQMLDISFSDFLSLIKHSTYVITDSFHAICFSYIFKKEFVALDKKGFISTNSRIKSILRLMGIEERLIKEINEIKKFQKIDYKLVDKKIENIINSSKEYLNKCLK